MNNEKVNTMPNRNAPEPLCHCGRPLHYVSPGAREFVDKMVKRLGEFVPVVVEDRVWRVQRHYLALHGIKAWELPELGFEELTKRPEGGDG